MSPPWMPLYVADYLADTGHLSTGEHGAYLLLLMHYSQRGSLPRGDKALMRIARMSGLQWVASRETLATMFDADWTPLFRTHFEHQGYRYVPQDIRDRVMQAAGGCCFYCGASASEIDHFVPIARGGTNDEENLVAACRPCNASKGAKLVSEWKP